MNSSFIASSVISPSFISLSSQRWRSLYQDLVSVPESSVTLDRIVNTRNAVLDRAEEILTDPPSNERQALTHALHTLRRLEQTAVRDPQSI